jgi:Tfp pilus assembly protein PilE
MKTKVCKVRAFTILEVVISMLITAIVIAITYTSYSIISKSYGAFNDKNKTMADFALLDHLLRRDFAQAAFIQKDAEGITLTAPNNNVRYTFSNDYILRQSLRTDTFKFTSQALQVSFEHKPLLALSDTLEQNRVDEISFDLLYQNEKIPYHYQKDYSSENLINRVLDAIH